MTTKTIAISGAAAGIGRGAALRFLSAGWTVGAFDIDEAGLTSLADEADRLPGRVVTGPLDVRDAEQFTARVDELVAETGGLDVLLNNAGILLGGAFEELGVEAHTREIDINVKGVVNGLHAAFPHLRRTPGATVVNMASASSIYGQAGLSNYAATKFFVRGITEGLDIEWRRHDIRVVDLWPLYVQTAMTAELSTGSTNSLGVRLTTDDVVDGIWKAVHPTPANRALHQVHFAVGAPARAMAVGARFSPSWLTRLVNKKISQH